MVPPDSDRVSRAPPYLRTIQISPSDFDYGTITVFGPAFQRGFVYRSDFLLISRYSTLERSPCNPSSRNAAMLTRARFRLFPVRSPLLRESRLMSFPPAT